MSLNSNIQLTTFYVGNELYGIEVMKVQEVTGQPNITPVPLSPKFIRGLINLRGQIATAVGMAELMDAEKIKNEEMTVVCKVDGNLISLVVDSIGDVVEVQSEDFENSPDTLPAKIKSYIKGIYKLNGTFLSVIDIDSILKEITDT